MSAEGVLGEHEWWLTDLAQRLGMPRATLHNWRHQGWVEAREVAVAGGRWAVWADDEELDRLGRLRRVRRGWSEEAFPYELLKPKRLA